MCKESLTENSQLAQFYSRRAYEEGRHFFTLWGKGRRAHGLLRACQSVASFIKFFQQLLQIIIKRVT
jgi:hypothetical protein